MDDQHAGKDKPIKVAEAGAISEFNSLNSQPVRFGSAKRCRVEFSHSNQVQLSGRVGGSLSLSFVSGFLPGAAGIVAGLFSTPMSAVAGSSGSET